MSTPAYTTYIRRETPPVMGNAVTDSRALRNWLGTELGTVQRAIPFRVTKTVTAAYSVLVTDDILLCDATTAAFTVTLPDPTRVAQGTWTVKKIDATAAAITLSATGGATIEGQAAPLLRSQWSAVTVRSNGTLYYFTNAVGMGLTTGQAVALANHLPLY